MAKASIGSTFFRRRVGLSLREGGGFPCSILADRPSMAGASKSRPFRADGSRAAGGPQAIRSQSRGDAIDENGQRRIILLMSLEIALGRIECLVAKDIEAQDLEPVAGVEIVMDSLQAFGEQGGDAPGLPQRPRRAGRDAEYLAIDAKQDEFENASADTA